MIYTLNIKNWAKHQARSDVKRASWMKLDNRIFLDSKFMTLDVKTRMFWVFILCEASFQSKNGTLELNVDLAAFLTTLSKKEVLQCIDNLEEKGLLSGKCNVDVTDAVRARTLDKRRGEEIRGECNIATGDLVESAAPFAPEQVPSGEYSLEAKKYGLEEKFFKQLEEILPSQLLKQEFQKMAVWLAGRPNKAKRSEKGWKQFITNWMNRALDMNARRAAPAGNSNPTRSISDEVLNGTYGK